MGMTALKIWRLIVPGVLILILILFVIQESFTDLAKTFTSFQSNDIVYTIIVVAVGVLYYILNIRKLLWNTYLNRVQNNIKNTLLSAYEQPLSTQQKAHLIEGRKLMIIFYHFIDNDKSLLEKAKRVRFNGLIWTSVIDLTIISVCGSLIFWVKFIIEANYYYLAMALILIILALVSFGLIQLTTRHHLSLSNEQLEIICQSYKTQLEDKINELLQNQ